MNQSGVLSGIQAEQLHQWLHGATRNGAPDATNWKRVVATVKEKFCDGALVEKSTSKALFLISKGDSDKYTLVLQLLGASC